MDKQKRINELIYIELDGVSKTIMEYSTDQFITSYAQKLCMEEYRNNPTYLKYLVIRLKEWYANTIEEINRSQYVLHKHLHKKSFNIIVELSELLES